MEGTIARVLLPRFEVVARRRPVSLVAPGTDGSPPNGPADGLVAGAVAPYVAVQATRAGTGRAELRLVAAGLEVVATYDDTATLAVTASGRTTHHVSRRHGRPPGAAQAVALTLTGPQVTALTQEDGAWVVRSRFDLTERDDTPVVHDQEWLSGLRTSADGPLADVRAGRFGQLGLRDLRLVTRADGTPYRGSGPLGDRLLLTATSAGPGWFPTAHASVWSLDPGTLDLTHRADLYLRRQRGGRTGVYGDHAVHLVRDGGRWLVATSTWGDFHPKRRPVGVALAESTDDLTTGVHVLDSRPLHLPTDGLRSVGVWDPHLVRTDAGWLVGFVSASRYFRFHPALAAGVDLGSLHLVGADISRRETEGTTLVRRPDHDGWWILASDKRRRAYPVYDEQLREVATLDAAYPSNIPWPTVIAPSETGENGEDGEDGEGSLMVGFDGTRYGGALAGYGTHGDVVIQRSVRGPRVSP